MVVDEDVEVLEELLEDGTRPEPTIYRFQGLLLFFSISIGALGLGASLAYFTREVRPPRRLVARRPPANPRRPAPRRLVPSPVKLLATATATPAPVKTDLASSVAAAPTSLSPAPLATGASEATSTPLVPQVVLPASPSKALQVASASSDGPEAKVEEPPPAVAPAAPAPADSPDASMKLSLVKASDPLSGPNLAVALKFYRRLTELLHDRYAHELPVPSALGRTTRVALPRWMNLVYLQRLTSRALDAAEIPLEDRVISVKEDTFGSGSLEVEVTSGGLPAFTLGLDKPSAATRLALIVDDVGYGGRSTRDLLNLQAPFSVAILPFYPGSKWAAKTTLDQDLESMLHLPMQPKGAEGKYRKQFIIGPHLEAPEIARRAQKAIQSLPGISGVNNHMGSHATESWYVMGEVLPLIHKHELFFVDSVTSSRSVAFRSAKKLGLKTAKRTTSFLDNDPSYEGVRDAFRRLLRSCRPGQSHVAILHDKPDSVKAMREAIPQFLKQGIELAFAGDMVR